MSLPPTQTTDTEHNDWVTKNNVSSVEEKKLHTHTQWACNAIDTKHIMLA